mgnify:CR=1 FL=1
MLVKFTREGLDHQGLDHEGAKGARRLDHEGAKGTRRLDHEGAKGTRRHEARRREEGAPPMSDAPSRFSRFVPSVLFACSWSRLFACSWSRLFACSWSRLFACSWSRPLRDVSADPGGGARPMRPAATSDLRRRLAQHTADSGCSARPALRERWGSALSRPPPARPVWT